MIWQWVVIKRHNANIPRSDMFYSYISLAVFIASVISSWMGYTLLSVQMLIWWFMQLTCILTINCVQGWVQKYGERKHLKDKPITKTWFYDLLYRVLLPSMGVLSVIVAIYWAADAGITKGYADGSFGINRNCTRGECMMFLWRLKGKPAPKAVAKAPFPDVPKSHVFYNAVLWGYQKNITTGFTS